jgi:hypothetical protein
MRGCTCDYRNVDLLTFPSFFKKINRFVSASKKLSRKNHGLTGQGPTAGKINRLEVAQKEGKFEFFPERDVLGRRQNAHCSTKLGICKAGLTSY